MIKNGEVSFTKDVFDSICRSDKLEYDFLLLMLHKPLLSYFLLNP